MEIKTIANAKVIPQAMSKPPLRLKFPNREHEGPCMTI